MRSMQKAEYRFGRRAYSQCGEDLIMAHIFGPIGVDKPTYIDIGAHHPFYLSNTAYFYERGSTGLNIEPDPKLFAAFKKHRPKDTNLNIGISSGKSSTQSFYLISNPVLNTFSKVEAESYRDSYGYEITDIVEIPVMPLSTVISMHLGTRPVDLLSIDVEGLDFEILKTVNFREGPPAVICIETMSYSDTGEGVKNTQIIQFLEKKGYLLYADTNLNSIFVRQDRWRRHASAK